MNDDTPFKLEIKLEKRIVYQDDKDVCGDWVYQWRIIWPWVSCAIGPTYSSESGACEAMENLFDNGLKL